MLTCQAELFCNIIVLSVTQYDKVTIIALVLRWSYSRIWVLLVLYFMNVLTNILLKYTS